MTRENIIQFDDFAKVNLRVGEIVEVEEIEGADKLWKLNVDLGNEIGENDLRWFERILFARGIDE